MSVSDRDPLSGITFETARETPPEDERERLRLTEEQRERVAAEREKLKQRTRERVIGYAVLVSVVLVLLIPALLLLGFETGLFVWSFNIAREL